MSNVRRQKLWNGDKLSSVVEGALEAAIHDHGPITATTIRSATKRVVSQVRQFGFTNLVTPTQHARTWERRYEQLKHGHEILLRQHAQVRAERDALRARLSVSAEPRST